MFPFQLSLHGTNFPITFASCVFAQHLTLCWFLYLFMDFFANPAVSMLDIGSQALLFHLRLKSIIHSYAIQTAKTVLTLCTNSSPWHTEIMPTKRLCDLLTCLCRLTPRPTVMAFCVPGIFPVLLNLLMWLVWKFLIITPKFDLTHSLFQNILTSASLFTPHCSVCRQDKVLLFNMTDKQG